MKFGHLEYDMKKVFSKKLCTNCGGEVILKLLPLVPKSLDQYSKVSYTVCFYYKPSWGLSKDI